MENVKLLTDEERIQLPRIINSRTKFRQIVKLSITNYDKTFSNSIMISGKPGTGKTTLVEELLTQLREESVIADYNRVPGHITPRAMYHILRDAHEPLKRDGGRIPNVVLLDDTDCLGDEGCLELLKAALDTKSNTRTNRKVFYQTEDGGNGFYFNGFGIIICNNDFTNRKLSVHQEALLDRVQLMSIDLAPGDMNIYTSYLVEQMLNVNEDNLTPDEISSITELFNNEVRRWIRTDAFRSARVNFSIRLIKKFVDAQRVYGEDWKAFNITYNKLNAAADLAEAKEAEGDVEVETTVLKTPKAAVIKRGTKPKMKEGLFINSRTGKPFSAGYQAYLKKKYNVA